MSQSAIRVMQRNWVTRTEPAWLARFLGKLVLDILPAALASVIGGFLFTQYHSGYAAPPRLVDVQPASPEMMAMVRDEHALIVSYLKAQMAAERRRDLAEDADTARAAAEARAAADAKLADALFAPPATAQQSAAAAVPRKAPPARAKPAVILATAPHVPLTIVPLTIAQANPVQNGAVAASGASRDDAPREPHALLDNPLVAGTLDIKDHVVAATRHVVSVIGAMFASVGDSIGGAMSGSRQFNSAS